MSTSSPTGDYSAPPSGNPPPQSAAYAPAQAASPASAYTPWLTRVLAFVIDYIPYAVLIGIGLGIEAGTQEKVCATDTSEFQLGEFCATGNSSTGVAAVYLTLALGFAYLIWNYGYKQGTSGSSIGKSIMKFKVISAKTGQPIGFGLSIVRQIAHVADSVIFGIGYLFPLWDSKRQTIADKIMTTVCVPVT